MKKRRYTAEFKTESAKMIINGGLLQQSQVMRFRSIASNKSSYTVDEMCECLEVSRSGYYAWHVGGPKERWLVRKKASNRLARKGGTTYLRIRGGCLPEGLIHHSDRGSSYASYDYQDTLESCGIRQGMSAKGNCYDNAAIESFFV